MSSISQSIYFPSDRWNPIERGKKRTKKIERNTKAPSSFDALIPFEMCANSTRSLYTCTSDIAYIWNIIHTRVNSIRISSFSLELILVLVDAEIDCTSWNDERWRLFQISLKSMVGEDNRCGWANFLIGIDYAEPSPRSLCPMCVRLFNARTHMRARTANTFSFYCIRKSNIWLKMYTMYRYMYAYVCVLWQLDWVFNFWN